MYYLKGASQENPGARGKKEGALKILKIKEKARSLETSLEEAKGRAG
jgi:hypothetical protein